MDGITLEALNQKLKEGNLDPRELEKATKCKDTLTYLEKSLLDR